MSDFSENGDIPTFGGSDKAKAADFANYFCSYAQLYHQKQMLVDSNRMAAYHAAIIGNADVFKDKVRDALGEGEQYFVMFCGKLYGEHFYIWVCCIVT